MAVKRGGGQREDDDLATSQLQAILLADTFDHQQFRPISHQRPKVLLPLVNVPMIAYTLSWLESNGVTQVFVFCCNHAKQIMDYLKTSGWLSKPNFLVSTIVSRTCLSSGDALRFIYDKNVIHTDFILVNGDTITNMSLIKPLQEHKERRREDSNAIMTMVIKQSMPSPVTHYSRLGTDELIIAIDPDTKQLFYYEDEAELIKVVSLDKSMLSKDPPSVSLYSNRQDCCLDICSPQVLALFNENFDYQHIRRDFLKGTLLDGVEDYKIFTYEICSSYAARIHNIRSYDAISKDIIQRWTYPLVPDVQFFQNSATNLKRQGVYRASEVGQPHSAHIGPCTVIGSGTIIGTETAISHSVVGEGCSIGSNVTIDSCYIWHNVTIEDGCELKHAIVCDGAIVKAGAALQPGVVLSFNVVVGEQFVVPSYSKVSLLRQPIKQDIDDELDYADNSPIANGAITSDLGYNGIGFIWSSIEEVLAEEWRHSVVPIPADKLVAVMRDADSDPELLTLDDCIFLHNNDSDSVVANDDKTAYFEKEVEETFLRAVEEDVEVNFVILEVMGLKLSYNMTSLVCAGALFYSLMKFAFDTGHNSNGELYRNVTSVMVRWRELLKSTCQPQKEIEVLRKFEDLCMKYFKQYTSLFEQILYFLYDKLIIQEEAVLKWASEKEKANESHKFFVEKAKSFIKWLKEAPEED